MFIMKYFILKLVNNSSYFSIKSQLNRPIVINENNMEECTDCQMLMNNIIKNNKGDYVVYAIFFSEISSEEILDMQNMIKCSAMTTNDFAVVCTNIKIKSILKIYDDQCDA